MLYVEMRWLVVVVLLELLGDKLLCVLIVVRYMVVPVPSPDGLGELCRQLRILLQYIALA